MAAELVFAPETEQDVIEAYTWYERQRSGLGEEFLSCLDATFHAISRNPEMYAIVHEDYRRA
ncbi:MAG TPA: type II toxin-antitoxin system RelE/ParE family toxin, partial [Blastocatellia bacterium]